MLGKRPFLKTKLPSQNLRHRLTPGQLINQFVQIPYFLHQRVFDFFHADAAHDPLDQRTIRMHGGGLGKKGFKIVYG